MGLFGLISQNTNRRTKEIGVRKILGASINSIVFTLTNELLKWVAIANIITWPLAWFIMNRWLQNFAIAYGNELVDVCFLQAELLY